MSYMKSNYKEFIKSRVQYYDRQGQPMNLLDWGRRFEDMEYKIVKQTTIGEFFISTVWFGLNYSFGDGPPMIFETMIFQHGQETENELDGFQERYATEAEAEAGHAGAVAAVISYLAGETQKDSQQGMSPLP